MARSKSKEVTDTESWTYCYRCLGYCSSFLFQTIQLSFAVDSQALFHVVTLNLVPVLAKCMLVAVIHFHLVPVLHVAGCVLGTALLWPKLLLSLSSLLHVFSSVTFTALQQVEQVINCSYMYSNRYLILLTYCPLPPFLCKILDCC